MQKILPRRTLSVIEIVPKEIFWEINLLGRLRDFEKCSDYSRKLSENCRQNLDRIFYSLGRVLV